VVDDDDGTRELLGELLGRDTYEVVEAGNGVALRALYGRARPDVVLLDWRLPDADGIELLPELKQRWPETQVIILTGYATFDAAVDAVKHGAFHFLSKPFQPESLQLLVQRACEHKHLQERTTVLERALSTLQGRQPAVFSSPAMGAILRLVERIAGSDAPVLITGESGTGKEVVADLVHVLSPRAAEPFVKVNCAALPRELIESELFGAIKGAYTGAHADREGLFREAGSGTILLDEISEMPLDTQAKLLRVLQERSFRPVGGKTKQSVDCRVLASTNRRIDEALREGRLREDVYYRISAVTVHLPPLRERREDILPLATTFLRRFGAQAGRAINGFTEEAARVLREADWPGNVRQLENEIQRAVLFCDTSVITVGDLSIGVPADAPTGAPPTTIEAMERQMIIEALRRHQGNRTAAARELGIDASTLFRRIRSLGLADSGLDGRQTFEGPRG
jgi:DNA-binding NtrC family response regulator